MTEQRVKEARDLLKSLLEIRSVNSRDNAGEIAAWIRDYFLSFGVSSQVRPIDGMHANVTAFLPGRDPDRTVVWNGHMDTVPYGSLEEWDSDPALVREADGRYYARGASDMKSGLAAMIYALTHLEGPPACNIRFLGTCDEEKGGRGAQAAEADRVLEDADCLLIGEPTDMRPGTAQKGCLWLRIRVTGRTSHGAYPAEGINAVEKGWTISSGIRDYVYGFRHGLLGTATAQITEISAGVAPNMTPDQCLILMDIRLVPGLTVDMVLEKGRELAGLAAAEAPGTGVEFEIVNQRRAIEIREDHPMTATLQRLLTARGYSQEEIGINFFTDASVLDRTGDKNILLFGPGETRLCHKPNEYVDLKCFDDAVGIYMEMLREFPG